MHVALTGGSGFLGRRFRQIARARGWEVSLLARPSSTLSLHEGERRVAWDARADDAPELAGVDAVINLAAFIPPDYRAAAHAAQCMQVNALGTLALVERAARAGVPHFVQMSTGNLYAPCAGPVDEDAPTYPAARATYYLASKLAGELYVEHARRAGRIETAVLRPPAIYGPGMADAGLVPTFATRLLAHEPVVVADGGRYAVDLVFVDDVAEAAALAVERRAAGVFNVGTGAATTTGALADALVALTGADPALVTVEPPGDGPAGGFAPLDIRRAQDALGFAPTPLDEGLATYVAWLRERDG